MSKFNYKSQYGLVVVCATEKEQQQLYAKLKQQGLTVKVVVV